jgi:hypothetical protein
MKTRLSGVRVYARWKGSNGYKLIMLCSVARWIAWAVQRKHLSAKEITLTSFALADLLSPHGVIESFLVE